MNRKLIKFLKKNNAYASFMVNAKSPECLGIYAAMKKPKNVGFTDAFCWGMPSVWFRVLE